MDHLDQAMLDWLKPNCPVDLRERVFLERSLGKLATVLRVDFRKPRTVLLPDHFDSICESGSAEPESVFRHIMRSIGTRVDGWSSESTVLPPIIQIRWDEFLDRAANWLPPDDSRCEYFLLKHFIATVISCMFEAELSHVTSLAEQHWWVDLYAVLLGAGVYPANNYFLTNYRMVAPIPTWSIGPDSQLSSVQVGYAMAVDAWLRHEPVPAWANVLSLDARESLERGHQYLDRNGSSLLDRDRREPYESNPGAARVAEELRSTDVARRVNAILDVMESGYCERDILIGVGECLQDDVTLVQMTACYAAARLGEAGAPLFDYVARLSESPSAQVRMGAVVAIAAIPHNPHETIQVLKLLTADIVEPVSLAATRGLLAASGGAEPGMNIALARLESALKRADGHDVQSMLDLIAGHVEDVGCLVNGLFRDGLDEDARGVLDVELARFSGE